MKKLYIILITWLLLLLSSPALAYTASFTIGSTKFYVDGQERNMDVAPIIIDGRTFMPVRFLANSLGLDDRWIYWYPDTQKIHLIFPTKPMELYIDNKILKIVGQKQKQMDVAPIIIDGRTMLPFRPIAEEIVDYINWNDETKTVSFIISQSTTNTSQSNTIQTLSNNASAEELQNYLNKKYSLCNTKLTAINIDYQVRRNDNINFPEDYYINFYYDINIFESICNSRANSIQYANTGKEDAELARKQLKDFIEVVAKDVINKMPNKKIKGNTENKWYRYPHIKKDLFINRANSWRNYDLSKTFLPGYNDSTVSSFRWVPEDDRLLEL